MPDVKNNIEIKKATIADIPVLALLGRVTYAESHAQYIVNPEDVIAYSNKVYSIENTSKEIKDENMVFWIARVNDLPVGFAVLKLHESYPKLPTKNNCKLQRIYVLKDFLSMKIGKTLQQAVIEEAKALNFDEMWLNTYYKNTKAINFYNKSGYREVGEDDFWVEETNYKQIAFSIKL